MSRPTVPLWPKEVFGLVEEGEKVLLYPPSGWGLPYLGRVRGKREEGRSGVNRKMILMVDVDDEGLVVKYRNYATGPRSITFARVVKRESDCFWVPPGAHRKGNGWLVQLFECTAAVRDWPR